MTESLSNRRRALRRLAGLLVLTLLLSGCSVRSLAINALARSLAASGDVYASDGDPELIRQATPFALKTIEGLLAEKPDHQGLLLAACQGFTQYAYAFVELDAERLEESDYDAAEREYGRALGLYLRAREYCFTGLEARLSGVRGRLQIEPDSALEEAESEDVPLLFWTAASWGSAISVALDRPDLTVDFPAVRALVRRVEELDPTYNDGAVYELLMVLATLPEAMGGSPDRALHYFERAVELSGGQAAAPYVALAESLMVPRQDRGRFEQLLHEALAIDPDAAPSRRLANVLAQERARWLLDRADELFL
jgi:predicted anti-sigma-YlaC factor YlaD